MRRTTTLIAGIAVAVLLAACGGDDDESGANGANPLEASADLGEDAPACTALPGTPTDEIMAHATCADETGTVQVLTFASYGCPDGRRLVWNDFGWGYTGGPWQAHARADGQLVPPDEDMAVCTAP